MSDVTEELDWDGVLGEVDKVEEERKKEGKSDNDFEALPKGPYNVVVQEADKQIASTGKDMIKAKVRVTEGPYVNRTLFNYFVFGAKTDATLNKITLNDLAAFGVTREYIAKQKPSIAEIAESLVGRTATAVVGVQENGEYKGRNEIKRFKPLEGASQPAPAAAATTATSGPKPNIPTPEVATPTLTPTPTPVVPVPNAPVAGTPADAADPFG